jgi:transposase|tara:strand:+ start:14425 stop:14658 length:234 start_codon:yes stop_codon:yes gene_type:complete
MGKLISNYKKKRIIKFNNQGLNCNQISKKAKVSRNYIKGFLINKAKEERTTKIQHLLQLYGKTIIIEKIENKRLIND